MTQEYLIGDIFPGLFAVTTCHGNHLLKETEYKNIELYKLVRDKPQYVEKVNLDIPVDFISYQVVELLLRYHGFDTSSYSAGEWEEETEVQSKKVVGDSTVVFKFNSTGRVTISNNNNVSLSIPVTSYTEVIRYIIKFKQS